MRQSLGRVNARLRMLRHTVLLLGIVLYLRVDNLRLYELDFLDRIVLLT